MHDKLEVANKLYILREERTNRKEIFITLHVK